MTQNLKEAIRALRQELALLELKQHQKAVMDDEQVDATKNLTVYAQMLATDKHRIDTRLGPPQQGPYVNRTQSDQDNMKHERLLDLLLNIDQRLRRLETAYGS